MNLFKPILLILVGTFLLFFSLVFLYGSSIEKNPLSGARGLCYHNKVVVVTEGSVAFIDLDSNGKPYPCDSSFN